MHGGNDMPHRVPTSAPRLGLLLCDVILVIIAWLNMASMKEVAALPSEYQPKARSLSSSAANVGASRAVLRIEGNEADSPGLLRYYLCKYTAGDSVTVTDVSSNVVSERKIGLVAKYTSFDLGTMTVVGVIYFVFGIYVILKHSSRPFAGVLHALAVGTALMILCDWGSLKLYLEPFNALRWFIFDVAIWILPSLFLHFSFMYPNEKRGHRRLFTTLFYMVSLSGIGVSAYYLVQIFFYGIHIYDTHYLDIHAQVNDVFLIAGLLCAAANLEHSALAIQDPYDRKRIYWVLLGISFGPLVYVFLILVPRMMLDYELVSQSMMQYTLLMAPLMFYLAIRKNPNRKTGESA
jgi:hypothetical protein